MSDFSEYVSDAARAAGFDIDSPRGGGKKGLAEAAGMSQASVSRMLAGKSDVETAALPRIARGLNVPVEDLLRLVGLLAADEEPRSVTAAAAVSRNVRRLRRQRDWTQEEAGERLGHITGESWSNAVWSAAEQTNGKRQRLWTADDLVAMARLFGVTVAELIGDLPEVCSHCNGQPPTGFTCNTCGGAR